ncbi:polysaccharide biosynthesis C-terminal domain-containing protein [Nocardioides renjunii]|uniref:polysaccharide biosynthesis C-terminal domain-containing protein n=1 Tax=Nocardioides renjunii TaxID=3095075 RepID=UPI002AFF9E75|nr:NAD-dependent epimerase/dehydratase family protein [Nocardioides sp. S-34]WQQ22158.1 NAD-dependent epimerase/dehydratase family protein [Nocardioides sp. S-34]
MKILLTGAEGFLGWHLRCRVHATSEHEIVPVGRAEWDRLAELVAGADAVIHVAGVNRASDDELVSLNVGLAQHLAAALATTSGVAVVFANSIQVGNGTAYAEGKAGAADVLRGVATRTGGRFVDVRLPNLFGEHGRPGYNSFVATFVDRVISNDRPDIADRPIELLHAQGAAQALLDALEPTSPETVQPSAHPTSVQQVWDLLERFHATYVPSADVPAMADDFERDLFNTYRAALFPDHYPLALTPRSDARGRLVETVRSHGQGGQTFVSTTVPGVTRGIHYHLHKIERFVVLDGEAVIRLRRMFHDEVVELPVSGKEPVVVDMPTMWSHDITNVGEGVLTTLFWTDSLFHPDAPDTIHEPVVPSAPQENP